MATKLAPPLLTLLLLLLLFQLGFGVKSRLAVDAGLRSSRDSKLHVGEVYALKAVISGLGLDMDPNGVCKTCDPGFVIKCNCSFKNNTECHIKYMKIKSGIDLSNGTIHDYISNFTLLETL
ncbi:uncharacterized protein LOC131173350 [Hevea brasiliensis]|uniref:uncharacterized protein LOC131173350 n=1 Tax=Hevea brasiliensis TaxID=3981 RepID=UPI0025E40D28|nr:uncharacterized protein LOC131173350 [Hevea brasiliensis]